jgi:methyl-accepting chemotaxis protein
MSDILENEGLKNVIVDKTEYPHFSLINRVFLLTVSIALIPLGILGFFIHLINTNQLVLTHLGWHMIFIFLLSAIAIIVSLHEMKISTNRSVLTVESALGSIRQGDLTIKSIPMLSANELGSISQFVNALLNQLKEIVLNVKSTSDTVYTSALDINSASQGLSASANEQAAGVEEISSTIEEMFSSVTQNAEHSNEADKLSEGSLNLSGEGTKVVEKAVSSIHEVNQFGTKISDIISLINDIAFQTNLLALNASVEAARAGESGRGFAVVASEVRNLAQRSRTASDEIGKLIKETIEKVETGTELVNESGKSLSAIYNSAKQVRNIISELNVANQEQKAGLGQISAAINQAETTTQETASAAEELASTAENLKQNSVELQHLISYFRI